MTELEEIQRLYEQVPHIDCQGKCHRSCGPITLSDVEREHLASLGAVIPIIPLREYREMLLGDREPVWCSALGPFKNCTVYEDRPLICRLWGVTEGLPCPWGCTPERVLSNEEARHLIDESQRIGGVDPLALFTGLEWSGGG